MAVIGESAAIGRAAASVPWPRSARAWCRPRLPDWPACQLSHALLGARVYVYPGARIGQEGFGFAITARDSTACRNSAASSWKTTSRSVPTRQSTAARCRHGDRRRLAARHLVQIGTTCASGAAA